MARKVISADGHLDLFYLPPDSFTSRTSTRLKDKVPQVVNIDGIPTWVGDGAVMGAYRGWMGRGGLTGHRGKRMMEAGWEPTHPSDPKLRLKDLDIDGVEAEVIYGIRFVEDSIKNPEAITATYRAYNDFIAEFCEYNPKRLIGVADIPAHSVEGAVDEIRRIGKGGLGLRGALFDWFNGPEPIWHPMWEPLWSAAGEADVALSFHIGAGHGTTTVGPRGVEEKLSRTPPKVSMMAHQAVVAMQADECLASVILCGALERHPKLKVVLAESHIGWIPICSIASILSSRKGRTRTSSRPCRVSYSAGRCGRLSRTTKSARAWRRTMRRTVSAGHRTIPTWTRSGPIHKLSSASRWRISARQCRTNSPTGMSRRCTISKLRRMAFADPRQLRTSCRAFALLLIVGLFVRAAVAAEKPEKLRIAYITISGSMAALWTAAAAGEFQKEALDVELVYIQANAAIAAVLAGEVDAVEISAPGIVPVVLAGGNLTMIAGLLNKMIYSLHAQKEIKSAAQLRGKVVGTDRIGSPGNYGVRTTLVKLGLNPDSDVKLLAVGGLENRWPALISGQIAAAVCNLRISRTTSCLSKKASFSRPPTCCCITIETRKKRPRRIGIRSNMHSGYEPASITCVIEVYRRWKDSPDSVWHCNTQCPDWPEVDYIQS